MMKKIIAILNLLVCILCFNLALNAVTVTGTVGLGTTDWSAVSWSPSAPGVGDDVILQCAAGGPPTPRTVQLDANVTISSLEIDDAVVGGKITLDLNGNSLTINGNMILETGAAVVNTLAGGIFTVTGNLTHTSVNSINLSNCSSATIGTGGSNTHSIEHDLIGSNTQTIINGVFISEGEIGGTGTFTINGDLDNEAGNIETAGKLVINGDLKNDGVLNATGDIELTGDFTNNSTTIHNDNTFTLTGDDQTIGGTTAVNFFNLTKDNGVHNLTFNVSITVDGTLTLKGSTIDNLLVINGAGQTITLNGTEDVNYVDVTNGPTVAVGTIQAKGLPLVDPAPAGWTITGIPNVPLSTSGIIIAFLLIGVFSIYRFRRSRAMA